MKICLNLFKFVKHMNLEEKKQIAEKNSSEHELWLKLK